MSSLPTLRAPRRAAAVPSCGYAVLRRVLFIHERLGNRHRANAVTLARELEVTPRTIKRDLAFMQDQLGAPIEWDASTGTYRYTRECDLLPLLRLDAAEIMALALAGKTFAAWGGTPLGQALAAALGKIAGVVGGAISLPMTALGDLVFQPDNGAAASAEYRWIAVALEAIQRRRVLRLDYRKPGARTAEKREVHPLHLAFLDHRWVLVAHDPARHDRRNFLLARIQHAAATPATFASPPGFDLQAYLRGSLGRFTGEKEIEVELLFAPALEAYLRESPWHSSQQLAPKPDGRVACRLRLNNLIDIRRRVLACGAQVEVLAPAELRDSLRTEAAALVARYAPSPM